MDLEDLTCNICSKDFASYSALQKHSRQVHKVCMYLNICPNFRTNELKVWTVLSTDDIIYSNNKCSLSYLVQ